MLFGSEREFDRALGIDTSLVDMDWSARRLHPCQPTPLAALDAVANRMTAGDCIVDCGCGTGRAVFFFAAAGFNAVGVELDRRRFDQAWENLEKCRRRAPEVAARVHLVHGSAQDYMPEDRVTAYYFFNPFPAAVLRGVLKRINSRKIRLFCYYPDDEWLDVLAQMGWMREESIDLQPTMGRDPRERVDVFVNACL